MMNAFFLACTLLAIQCVSCYKIYAIGGQSDANWAESNVQILDLSASTPTWISSSTSFNFAMDSAVYSNINNRIYALGGSVDGLSSVRNHFYTCDLASSSTASAWSASTFRLATSRAMHGSVIVDNKIWTIGGQSSSSVSSALTSIEVFDLSTSSFMSSPPSLPVATTNHAVVAVSGLIYVIGGQNSAGVRQGIRILNPVTGVWTDGPPSWTKRSLVAASAGDGGKIYIVGGTASAAVKTVDIYDTATGTISLGPDYPTTVVSAAAVWISDALYVVGGSATGSSGLRSVYRLAATAGATWQQLASLASGRWTFSVVTDAPPPTGGSSSGGSTGGSSSGGSTGGSSSGGSTGGSSSGGSTGGNAPAAGSVSLNLTAAGAVIRPSDSAFAFFLNSALNPTFPTVSAGTMVTSYSVSPALPSGLLLSASTGDLSGTPTSVRSVANYTITASNPAGQTTFTLRFAVVGAPANVSLSLTSAGALTDPATSSLVFFAGAALTSTACVVLPAETFATAYSISPSLPAGMDLSTTTGILSGTPTAASALATYTITASNPAGQVTSTITFLAVFTPTLSGYPSGILYEGMVIRPLKPAGTNLGVITEFTAYPPLPVGLYLDPPTGVITGIPLRASASVNYTVTAKYTDGSIQTYIVLTVIALADPLHPATTTGDPHIVGFKGQKFDIQGQNGRVYNLYSDVDAQLSVQLGQNMLEESASTSIVGMSFRFGKRGLVSFTAQDNQIMIQPRYLVIPSDEGWTVPIGECGEFRLNSKDGLEVVYNQYHLKVSRRAYFIEGLNDIHFFFLNVEFSAFPTTDHVDGVLGQTFRLPEDVVSTGRDGEGVLEHPLSDYEVRGGLSSLDTTHGRYRKEPGLDCRSPSFAVKLAEAQKLYSGSGLASHRNRESRQDK